ncbi:hypothetical protein ACROYT_G031598 [Oculina patagonica]
MGFSSVAAVCFTLFACLSQMNASVIPDPELNDQPKETSDKLFKLHITENGTSFDEQIEIDEERDIEYFKVPPHNELSESDNLYDFKMNITVTRVSSQRVCYISPLPPDLPRPNVLKAALKKMSTLPATHKIEKTIQQWRVGEEVADHTLRPEVQNFCGQYPVYRLEPFTADSVSVGLAHAGRTRRFGKKKFPLCENLIPPECNPNDWVYSCEISDGRCVYYVRCNLDQQNKILSCSDLVEHLYTAMVCCTPTCS